MDATFRSPPRAGARTSKHKPARQPRSPKGHGSAVIAEALRAEILSLALPPGADLDEQALVTQYGRSRTPVREALIVLASEGLVQIVRNRGARVAPLDIASIPALLEAHELVERANTRWAACRRSPQDLAAIAKACADFERVCAKNDYSAMASANRAFHAAIAAACGNRFLEEQHHALSAKAVRIARMAFTTAAADRDDTSYFDTVCRHHREMLRAISDHDDDAADRLAREHAQLFRSRMLRFFEASRAGDIDLQ